MGMRSSIKNVPITGADQSQREMTDQTIMPIKDMSIFEVKNITSNVNLAKEMVNKWEAKAAIILSLN